MMNRLLLGMLVLCLGSDRALAEPSPGPVPDDGLFETIAALDSRLFDAFNRCDLDAFGRFFSEDLEFYHDETGLTHSRQSVVDAVKNNICGKVRRDLVPGSLEVFPLRGFGAVELGLHRFCPAGGPPCDETHRPARFVHVWQNQDGGWKITRVISYDH